MHSLLNLIKWTIGKDEPRFIEKIIVAEAQLIPIQIRAVIQKAVLVERISEYQQLDL